MFSVITFFCLLFNTEYTAGCNTDSLDVDVTSSETTEDVSNVSCTNKEVSQGDSIDNKLLVEKMESGAQLSEEDSNYTAKTTKNPSAGSSNLTEGTEKMFKDAPQHSKDIVPTATGTLTKVTVASMKIGDHLITSPNHYAEFSINKAWAVQKLGVGLTNKIQNDTADWSKLSWEAVKVFEFPGKPLLVMMHPSQVVAVVDKVIKDVMYMVNEAESHLSSVISYAIYMILKVLFEIIDDFVKSTFGDCIILSHLGEMPVDASILNIHIESGHICGLSNLEPTNKVTITRNDQEFLIIKTHWVMNNIHGNFQGVEANSKSIGTVLKNETMNFKINRINATGIVSFEAGMILRFIRIRLRVDEIEGLEVHFPIEEETGWMEAIEEMAGVFSDNVRDEINSIFKSIEKAVSQYSTE